MIKLLKEKQGAALAVAKATRDEWAKANPNEAVMSKDFEEKFDKAMEDFDSLQAQIEREERFEKAETAAAEIDNKAVLYGVKGGKADADEKAFGEAFEAYLTKGEKFTTPQQKEILLKAYETGNNTQGGYFVSQQMATQVLTLAKDLVATRQIANIVTLSGADSLGVIAIDTDPADADWTAEIGTVSEETTLRTGKRELKPHLSTKLVKESRMLAKNSPNFVATVLDRLAYKFAVTEEKAFMTGTGVNQPLGVFTPSADGVSTSRDSSTASAGTLVADDIISAFYALHPGYSTRGTWVFSPTVLAAIRKLKASGTGEYIWVPDLRGGTQDILGRPFILSSHAPAYSASAGSYLMAIGDFSNYWIADSLEIEVQRMEELYAGTNQLGFIMRRATDGQPVQGEAFQRLKMS